MSVFDDRDADLQAVSAGSVASGKSAGGIWMVTFVDLVLLLFGFFVLLFSMSSLDTSGPAPGALAVLPTRADAPILLEKSPARADANIGSVSKPRAAATEYLTVLLRDALDRVPALRALHLEQEGDAVRISVPPSVWSGATPGLGDLAALLDRLDNRVVIIASILKGDSVAWSQGLSGAGHAADALRAAGFSRALETRVRPAGAGATAGLFVLISGEREGS